MTTRRQVMQGAAAVAAATALPLPAFAEPLVVERARFGLSQLNGTPTLSELIAEMATRTRADTVITQPLGWAVTFNGPSQTLVRHEQVGEIAPPLHPELTADAREWARSVTEQHPATEDDFMRIMGSMVVPQYVGRVGELPVFMDSLDAPMRNDVRMFREGQLVAQIDVDLIDEVHDRLKTMGDAKTASKA